MVQIHRRHTVTQRNKQIKATNREQASGAATPVFCEVNSLLSHVESGWFGERDIWLILIRNLCWRGEVVKIFKI